MPSSYTIGEHFETMVRDLVASGRYASASEVMRDGLRLIEEREQVREAKLDTLRKAIQEGLDSGEPEDWEIDSIKARGRQRLAARNGS